VYTVTTFNLAVSALQRFIVAKNEQNVTISHFKLSTFCWWERKNIISPLVQSTVATQLSAGSSASAPNSHWSSEAGGFAIRSPTSNGEKLAKSLEVL